MDSLKSSGRYNGTGGGSGKLKDCGPVPFQGIGTRLRRSRSKDHSSELDNLSTATALEIANLRQTVRTNAYDHGTGFGYLTKGGTLERPKRLYGFSNVGSDANSTFIQQPPPLYGARCAKNLPPINLYEDSRLLGHQYEEPHLILDHLTKDSIYELNSSYSNRRRSKDAYLMNGKHHGSASGRVPPLPADQPGDLLTQYHSYAALDGVVTPSRPNTTVIPPSKLFAKSFSTSTYNAQQGNNRLDLKTESFLVGVGSGVGSECSPKSQATFSSGVSSKQHTSGSDNQSAATRINVQAHKEQQYSNGGESDSSTKADSGLLLTRTSHELSSSSSSSTDRVLDQHLPLGLGTGTLHHRAGDEHILSTDRTFTDLASHQDEMDHSPPKLCLTSSSQSSVMHTYANPFQNGCGGSSFSEDTTGPIIPDMNTLRPSQLLKNSFAGSGPPPSLHSSSANNRNVISCLANRLWAQLGGGGGVSDHKADLNEHRCSWRVSTFTLIVLVFILLLVIIALSAVNTSVMSSQPRSDSPKVPCIVVEDLDSTSSSHLSSSSSSSSFDRSFDVPSDLSIDHSSANCPLSLPRDPLQFKEIRLVESGLASPFSFRLGPYSAWTVWFSQIEASQVSFQFYAPLNARMVLLADKNEPPSLAKHQIFQVISEEALSFANNRLQRRTIRDSSQLLQLESTHYFEQGSWYLTVVNDLDHSLPLVVNISTLPNNLNSHCPSNCHNHGHCHLGKCQCFPGFIGHDCADNVCPVFCGGHGQYLQGSCRCEAGWKGRECTIRVEECEVADCNGNGVCIEGQCQCRTGSKGEHCELADCLEPTCSEHGVCFEGVCICKAGWSGGNCSLPDTKLHQFFPNCSSNGVYDFETGQCACYSHFSGPDCSRFSCSLDCGVHGHCQDGRCQCLHGWSGAQCDQRQCDPRCLEHGKCANGSCQCEDGWMGKYCTLDGCPNLCSKHGRCVSSVGSKSSHNLSYSLGHGPLWSCRCEDGWGGRDCSAPQETNCNDEIDNDNDGLVDCADSECCRHEQCGHQSLMCITSPDPLDILLRKQPPSPISSFFQKVHFLIDDGSVQSYAQKEAYSERRVSVIRGQVVSKEFNGLIGVRVSVATDPQFGFTLTRSDGWFDILVNGGGIVTLQFQRNPFYPIKKSVYVAWNDIGVIQNPIVMHSVPDNNNANEFLNFFNHRASSFSFYSQFSLLGFGEINWSIRKSINSSIAENCAKHDYELLKPVIGGKTSSQDNLWLTANTGTMCGENEGSCILAETQTVHEKMPIGASSLNLIYQSSLAQGYLSTLHIRLTPSNISSSLRFLLVRILIEGNIHEKIFEAEPALEYSYAWNKRNVYKQKVYGYANAKVYVGYVYHGCGNVIWSAQHTKLRGYDMEISELGGWNLDIHHRYNVYDSLFQRGDGQLVYFQDSGHQHRLPLSIESLAGAHLQPRPFVCTSSSVECSSNLASVRFFSLVTLTSAPDGSVFVGDANLIRRIMTDGRVQLVYQFKSNSNRQTYDYYIAFNSMDSFLYISDPDKLQIVRIQISDKLDSTPHQESTMPDIEVVAGTGERCLPHDRNQCGDGKTGPEVQLTYPKGLAFGVDGSLFFADGSVIRVLDTSGYVHKIVGDWNKRQWKPSSCKTTRPASEIKLHWPTSLAVNPVDGALYFVDNYVLFRLNHEMHVSIMAGLPTFCIEDTLHGNNDSNGRPNLVDLDCHSHKLDSKMFSYCGEDILFGSITFAPNGVLYISDISRQSENRIFSLEADSSLVHVAGFKSHHSSQQSGNPNCSVERCSDITGHNCTCLITDSSAKAEHLSALTDRTLGLKAKLFSISALTVTGDGTVYVADEGSLRLYLLRTYAPQVDDQLEIKILSPNLGEMYTFNQFGQHMSTRSTVTGRTLFTFHYNQDNSFGKLTDVVDVAGNKVSFIRDPSGALHTIESSFGFKSHTVVNKLGLLEQVGSNFNGTLHFDYYPNGLIKSKMDSSTGHTYYYLYDQNGRVSGHVQPSGTVTRLDRRHEHSEEIVTAHQVLLFDDEPNNKLLQNRSNQWLGRPLFELNLNSHSKLKLKQEELSIEMQLLWDGSIVVNTSRNVNGLFSGKASQLSNAMLPMQAQMFPLISRCKIESHSNVGREQSTGAQQSLDLSVEYGLKMKSSIISAVEKFVAVNNSLALKLEYDWKANREIYYNQSQRPILYLQFDENGRPIQWVPNIRDSKWTPHSLTFDKAGYLASLQDGTRTRGYGRDRAGRLIEVRQADHYTRFSYQSDADQGAGNALQLPNLVTLRSDRKYQFEHDRNGRLTSVITPKSAKHELAIKTILGYYRFAYCPPIVEPSKSQTRSTSHCFLTYLNEQLQTVMKVMPYDHGKIIYKYGMHVSLSREFSKELHRSNENDNQLVDQTIYGNGFVERWYDRKSGNDLRGITRNGNLEFAIVYKYTRNSGLLKHQSYQFGSIQSVSQLTFNYRYDNAARLRTIQSKLGSINLPSLELSYNSKGQLETLGNFRYFERTANETLLGDGVALFVKRYESSKGRLRHASVTIADKEVYRVDYLYDGFGLLIQTRTFMRHLGANKMRLQNFTYDMDSQLVEVQGREHWRFVYDFNGNLVTFLFLGNRMDIDYDAADRVRHFSKAEDNPTGQSGSSTYVTDLRGFVVQRGDEQLSYSQLGQLLSAIWPTRHQVHLSYDYRSRLVIRRDHKNNVTQYFYGNPRKPNLVTHAFNNADGRVLSLVYDDNDDSLIMLRVNNENFYVACDQSNSPTLVFDHRGQVVKELHRSPYGHVLFDSNPEFYLPVGFHGGIPDPLTHLVHFSNGRTYDTLIGRWLTPTVDQLLHSNLLQKPRLINLYQFALNDPISLMAEQQQPYMSPEHILSIVESQRMLRSQTSALVEQDINIGQLRLLTQIKSATSAAHSLPSTIRSYFFSSLQFIIDQLAQFASFKTNYYSKLALQDWTSARSMWNLISTDNELFGANSQGILLVRNDAGSGDGHSTVQVYAHSRVDIQLVDFLNLALNGSSLVEAHLLMGGQDHFFLSREHLIGPQSLSQLNKYQHVLNYTVHTGQSETDKKPVVDVRIATDTVVINVRFGTTAAKERERVLRVAKKYAIGQRLAQERMNILKSRTVTTWTEDEKQFILSASSSSSSANNNNPNAAFKLDYYHAPSVCAQLVDDAANIVVRSKR